MTGGVTVEQIKQIIPFVMIMTIAIGGWVRMEMSQMSDDNRIKNLESKLDTKAMTEFAKWQVNVERDVLELRKVCK